MGHCEPRRGDGDESRACVPAVYSLDFWLRCPTCSRFLFWFSRWSARQYAATFAAARPWAPPPTVCLLFQAFQAFSCETFDDDRAFLRADYAVECGTDAHAAATFLAWLGLALYPFGISALYVALMARARPAILADKPSALSEALSFLVRDYEPFYLWWELMEAWKKLFLVGFAVLISPGSVVQLGIAFLFSLIFMLVVSAAAPFKDDGDDLFAKACGFSLTAVFFFSTIVSATLPSVWEQLLQLKDPG